MFSLLGFPGGSAGKESACSAGDLGSTPRSRRSPGGGTGDLLHCSWVSLVAQTVENLPAVQETWFAPWVGRAPRGGQGSPLYYSCLENPHGQRSLAGDSPWGRRESDMTEQLSTAEQNVFTTRDGPQAPARQCEAINARVRTRRTMFCLLLNSISIDLS